MSEDNQKKSLWARLFPTGKDASGKETYCAINLDELVHMDFSLAADGDKLNDETSTPHDIQVITQNYLDKRAAGDRSITLIENHTPEEGRQYLLPIKDDPAPSAY